MKSTIRKLSVNEAVSGRGKRKIARQRVVSVFQETDLCIFSSMFTLISPGQLLAKG